MIAVISIPLLNSCTWRICYSRIVTD